MRVAAIPGARSIAPFFFAVEGTVGGKAADLHRCLAVVVLTEALRRFVERDSDSQQQCEEVVLEASPTTRSLCHCTCHHRRPRRRGRLRRDGWRRKRRRRCFSVGWPNATPLPPALPSPRRLRGRLLRTRRYGACEKQCKRLAFMPRQR